MFGFSNLSNKMQNSKSIKKRNNLSSSTSMKGAKKNNLLAMSGMTAKKSMPKATPSTKANKMTLLNSLGSYMGQTAARKSKQNMLEKAKKMKGAMSAKNKFLKAMR